MKAETAAAEENLWERRQLPGTSLQPREVGVEHRNPSNATQAGHPPQQPPAGAADNTWGLQSRVCKLQGRLLLLLLSHGSAGIQGGLVLQQPSQHPR